MVLYYRNEYTQSLQWHLIHSTLCLSNKYHGTVGFAFLMAWYGIQMQSVFHWLVSHDDSLKCVNKMVNYAAAAAAAAAALSYYCHYHH